MDPTPRPDEDSLNSPLVPLVLLQVGAFAAFALGWRLVAGTCWIIFFGYVLYLIVGYAESAAAKGKQHREDRSKDRSKERKPPHASTGQGKVPRVRTWRERRDAFFRDWPER